MKIETIKPRIIRIAYHQEQEDKHYGSCLWAYFDFDLDRYMLNIQSDCGNAAYRWHETPDSESFLHLMARINEDYLINKLFEPEDIDVKATMDRIRKAMCLDDIEDEDEREDAEAYLEEIMETLEGCDTEREAIEAIEEWNEEHDFDLSDTFEMTVTDFNASQKRICQIFADYVQPEIKKALNS